MFASTDHDRKTLDFAQGGLLPLAAEAFLTDRAASGLSKSTVEFYRNELAAFLKYCEAQALTRAQDVTPDFLRRWLLVLAERRNPGGLHVMYRSLRVFFRWLESEEVMPDGWKDPTRKVKAPRVPLQVIEPIPLADIQALIETCDARQFTGARDKAMFLALLDTGARAGEFCRLKIADVDMTGSITIRQSKARRPRTVFFSRKTRRAIRAYLRLRHDLSPALWVTDEGEALHAEGLRQVLRRRGNLARLKKTPTAHGFRRAFALAFLRAGGDVFSLQRLLGHADLTVLRRYLAQTDQDAQTAHGRFSPVSRLGGDDDT